MTYLKLKKKLKKVLCIHIWKNFDKFSENKYKKHIKDKHSYVHAYCIKCNRFKTIKLNKLNEIEFDNYED